MTETIRLYKGRELGGKSFAIGVKNPKWTHSWVRVEFPETRLFATIIDGSIDGFPITYADGSGIVPAREIVKSIFEQNAKTFSQNSKGTTIRNHYGEQHKWFIDYSSDLEEFFTVNNIPVPADKRSIDEKMADAAIEGLQMQGIQVPAGQKAIEDAKAKTKELEAAQAELAKLKAENEELKTKKEKKQKKEAVAA